MDTNNRMTMLDIFSKKLIKVITCPLLSHKYNTYTHTHIYTYIHTPTTLH